MGGVLATFGLFCPTLRRFHQAGSTFCGLLAKSLSADFCTPFLGSIFDPFFGLRVFGKLLVLRDFLKLYGGFGPVFGPLFARTFHRDFCHRGVRVSSKGGMYLVGVVGSCRILILWMSGKWQVRGEVVYAGRRMSSGACLCRRSGHNKGPKVMKSRGECTVKNWPKKGSPAACKTKKVP